jgi:NAD-dependent dihydropyrimidine dehydrogenase PreA subunit
MATRKIVHIDEEKCNGCGLCITNCAEGALKIIDGKAKLVSDVYCDGLGACLGHCPQDAISVIEREADEFDQQAVDEMMEKQEKREERPTPAPHQVGCPGSAMRTIQRAASSVPSGEKQTSQLAQWPVQLSLVSPAAPYFKRADLLVTADCVPFAYADYHKDFLRGRAVVVGCPKLDDIEPYISKLEELIRINDLESITVLRMQVPCCGGMAYAVQTARDKAGSDIPIKVVTISIEGQVIKREYV